MACKAGKVKEVENTQEQRFSVEDDEPEVVGMSSTTNLGQSDEQEGQQNGINGSEDVEASYSSLFVPEETPAAAVPSTNGTIKHDSVEEAAITIVVPLVERRWEYQTYNEAPVDRVLQEYNDGVGLQYLIKLRDGCKQKVSKFVYITDQQPASELQGQLLFIHSTFPHNIISATHRHSSSQLIAPT